MPSYNPVDSPFYPQLAGRKLTTYDPFHPEWDSNTPEQDSELDRNYYGMIIESGSITHEKQLISILSGDDVQEQSSGNIVKSFVSVLMEDTDLAKRLLRRFSFLIIPYRSQQGNRDGFSRYPFDVAAWPGYLGNVMENGGSATGERIIQEAVAHWISGHPQPEANPNWGTISFHCDNLNQFLEGMSKTYPAPYRAPGIPVSPYVYISLGGTFTDTEAVEYETFIGNEEEGFYSVNQQEFCFCPKVSDLMANPTIGTQVAPSSYNILQEMPWRHAGSAANYFYESDALDSMARAYLSGLLVLASVAEFEDLMSDAVTASMITAFKRFYESILAEGNSESSIKTLMHFWSSVLSESGTESKISDLQTFVDKITSDFASSDSIQDLQTYVDFINQSIFAGVTVTDIQRYVSILITASQSVSISTLVQQYIELLNSASNSNSLAADYMTYVDRFISSQDTVSFLADFMTYVEKMSTLGVSASQAFELQKYIDNLRSAGASESQSKEIQGYIDNLLTAGMTSVVLSDLVTYLDTLITEGVSTSIVLGKMRYMAYVISSSTTTSTIKDCMTYLDRMISSGLSVSQCISLQKYKETLLTYGLFSSNVKDIQNYIDNLLLVGISSSNVLAHIRYLDNLVSTGYSISYTMDQVKLIESFLSGSNLSSSINNSQHFVGNIASVSTVNVTRYNTTDLVSTISSTAIGSILKTGYLPSSAGDSVSIANIGLISKAGVATTSIVERLSLASIGFATLNGILPIGEYTPVGEIPAITSVAQILFTGNASTDYRTYISEPGLSTIFIDEISPLLARGVTSDTNIGTITLSGSLATSLVGKVSRTNINSLPINRFNTVDVYTRILNSITYSSMLSIRGINTIDKFGLASEDDPLPPPYTVAVLFGAPINPIRIPVRTVSTSYYHEGKDKKVPITYEVNYG